MQEKNSNFRRIAEYCWEENYDFNKLIYMCTPSICSDLSWGDDLKNMQEYIASPVVPDNETDDESIENMEVIDHTDVDGISESKMFLGKLR